MVNRRRITLALLLSLAAAPLHAASGTLVPALYQTVFDSNGDPVNNAKICTYLAGTTTPATTYTDVALTTPSANPIRADSAGRWGAYLAIGVSYKFVLQDATGTVGVCDGAAIKTVDNVLAVPGSSNPTSAIDTVNARCSLTSGTPVTTSDVTAAATVYVEPYKGNRIALYDGATWNLRTVTEVAVAVPIAASTLYDLFSYDNATTPTYETLAWTNDTTRATPLTTQDGVLVKTGATTRRYLCSFRTTTVAGQTEDSAARRLLFNYYNRVRRALRVIDSTDTWTYTLAAFRQARASAANQVDLVVGVTESTLELQVVGMAHNATGAALVAVGIGEDSTTTAVTGSLMGAATLTGTTAADAVISASVRRTPVAGYHVYVWLESSQALGTTTWWGDAGAAVIQSGMTGSTEGD